MKRLFSVILSLIMVFSVLPVGSYLALDSGDSVLSGKTGDCDWSLDERGVLTVSGNGAMADYNYQEELPWGRNIKKVIIKDGVTRIGVDAFSDCTKLKNILIPASTTEVGEGAYYDCNRLETAGPIGSGSNIEFGWTDKIPDYAFYASLNLKNVTVPEGITTIGTKAFAFTANIVNVSLPSTLKVIEYAAFCDCAVMKTIAIPAGVISIGEDAFATNSYLEKIYFRGSKTEWEKITFGDNAIPENIELIFDYDCDINGHKYDNECDSVCNLCGETRNPPHVDADKNRICDVCTQNIIVYADYTAFEAALKLAKECIDCECYGGEEMDELKMIYMSARTLPRDITDNFQQSVDRETMELNAAIEVFFKKTAGNAPTCEKLGYRDYYQKTSDGLFYKDIECQELIGDAAALEQWLWDFSENGGVIMPLGHIGVCCEDISEGHYCIRKGCESNGQPIFHRLNENETACSECGTPAARVCSQDPTYSDFFVYYSDFYDDGKELTQSWYYINESITLQNPVIIARDYVSFLIADNVTFDMAAGYFLKEGCTVDFYYQSRGENKGEYIGKQCKCYNESTAKIQLEHIDDDKNGFCDNCFKAVISFIDQNGVNLLMDSVTEFESDMTVLSSGWYYVKDTRILFDDPLVIDGDVHLILTDGCYFVLQHGITVSKDNSLTLYSQSFGDNMGELHAKCNTKSLRGMAGIGGSFDSFNSGNITINGGLIEAVGGSGGAGIGGGFGGKGGIITINGGSVSAKGGAGAAGIGGGFNGNGEKFVMNGGTLTAKAGIGAEAEKDGAGIGGGYNGTAGEIIFNNAKSLTVSGGRAIGDGEGTDGASAIIKVAAGLIVTSNGQPTASISNQKNIEISKEFIAGDVNGDGVADASDCAYICLIEDGKLADYGISDYNNDGFVTRADADILALYIIGALKELPKG